MRLCLVILVMLWTVPAWAANRFVSPSGSGTTCSTGTPCSVATGLSQGVAGDHIIFKNGTYSLSFITVRSGSPGLPITFRAENSQLAILTPPANWTPAVNSPPTAGSGQFVQVRHSYITLRGFKFDGQDRACCILRIFESTSNIIRNIIIEENLFEDPQWQHTYISSALNIIMRHNTYTTGQSEGYYIGSSGVVTNLEVYGNTMTGMGSNSMDFKNTQNANIHHNIIEGQYRGDIVAQDGIITVDGPGGMQLHNNIIRNSISDTGVFDYVRLFNNQNIHHNVAYNITNAQEILWYLAADGSPLAASQFSNNTFCNTADDIQLRNVNGGDQTPAGLTQTGNVFNQAQGVCDTERDRIITEMAALPRDTVPETIAAPTSLTVVAITN